MARSSSKSPASSDSDVTRSKRNPKSRSSAGWLKEHFDDVYVQRSWNDGYRSRASYKLIEIDEKDRLLKPGMRIIDLGAAPGGWSQIASRQLDGNGTIIASDILPMESLPDVAFIQGDFTEQDVLDAILDQVSEREMDLVLSDMAPNMSGQAAIDQPSAMGLVELALDLARQVLRPGGDFLVKVFQGEGFDAYLRDMRSSFDKVMTRKPDASRARSREVYLLGRGFRR